VWSETREDGLGTGRNGRAGGGGGGAERVAYVDIASFAASSAPALSTERRRDLSETTVNPQLKTIVRSTPRVSVWEPVRPDLPSFATTVGTGGGAGSGPGTGGGIGAGVGTGIGDNIGPGTGGERAPAYAPEPRAVIYPVSEPPNSVKGRLLIIHFWVDDQGRVIRVEVEPEILSGRYLQEFLESMRQWVFYPARMADGTRVEGELVVTHRP
jgi:hypothetical protein